MSFKNEIYYIPKFDELILVKTSQVSSEGLEVVCLGNMTRDIEVNWNELEYIGNLNEKTLN